MGPVTDKVATAESLPQETKIAIIGGGIIGVSTALFLAERGIPVALLEKGEIAGEQSSRNWGWCRRTGRPRNAAHRREHAAMGWHERTHRS